MRRLRQFLLILACSLVCVFVTAGYDTRTELSMKRKFILRKEKLQLTTSIIDQKYCHTGSPSLRIKLQLNYKNEGRRSVILYKGSSLIFRYLISRNRKAATARDYVQDVQLELTSLDETEHFNTPNPGDDFVILRPNGFYRTEADVDLPIEDAANPNPDFLRAGTYFLQINVSTWNESGSLARKLRYRWRQTGALWFNSVRSQPMSFTVEKDPKIVDCP